ncbi:MAG: hypothetical protein ACXVXT_04205 [Blastococcus sp.]
MPRSSPFIDRWFRPSPQLEKFVTTPAALVLAALMALGGLVGSGLAVWRGHWVDAVVYALLAVALVAWLVIRLHRRHR